jgi:hypothetical protein
VTGWRRVFALVAALTLINGMTWIVVKENQRNGLYPVEADSIGLPILGTLLISFIVLPVLVSIGLLSGTQWMHRLRSHSFQNLLPGMILLAFYVIATLFALGGLGYWAVPDHYPIALCYLMLICVLILCLALDFQWLLSNRSRS